MSLVWDCGLGDRRSIPWGNDWGIPMLGKEQVSDKYQNGSDADSSRGTADQCTPASLRPGLSEMADVGIEARRAASQMFADRFVAFVRSYRHQPEHIVRRAAGALGVGKCIRKIRPCETE
jgi:hypothetical protein